MLILVGHQKGGVGKSTITVNLAAELQRRGSDVCIVEADPTVRTASTWAQDREEAGGAPIQTVRLDGNLRASLLDLGTRFDIVLVDAAGKDSKELRTAMTACDLLLAPLQPSQPDLDTTKQLMETVSAAKDFNESLKVMGVLNRVATNVFSREEAEARAYLKAFPDMPLAKTVLHERLVYRSSLGEGRGVVEMKDPKAKAEIQLLTEEALSW
jgi:chromosome partitioning protein